MIPVLAYVGLATLLFFMGAAGFLVRRNVLMQLMCVEIMLNATNLALVAFNRASPSSHRGQQFAFFITAIAAAEAAVGLAIVLSYYRLNKTVQSDEADLLRY